MSTSLISQSKRDSRFESAALKQMKRIKKKSWQKLQRKHRRPYTVTAALLIELAKIDGLIENTRGRV